MVFFLDQGSVSQHAKTNSGLGILGSFARIYTPPKINMEHNNGGLEDDFPFQIGDF